MKFFKLIFWLKVFYIIDDERIYNNEYKAAIDRKYIQYYLFVFIMYIFNCQ